MDPTFFSLLWNENLRQRFIIRNLVLWIQTHFFRIRILILIFWPQIFLNGASNCFHMCSGMSGTCTSEKTFFNRKKIFLFQVLDLRFFTQIFILQQCLDPNPYPNPNFFSDSDPAKTFGFGSTTLPQLCVYIFRPSRLRRICMTNSGRCLIV
jgi:hypothetical protein